MGVKLRMGMHNPITAEHFKIIKTALAGGMSDDAVMQRYEIKKTTLGYIKKSATFYEYRLYTEMLPAARKMPKVVEPNSGVAYEDYGSITRRRSNELDREAERTAYAAGMWAVLTIAVLALICVAVIVTGGK